MSGPEIQYPPRPSNVSAAATHHATHHPDEPDGDSPDVWQAWHAGLIAARMRSDPARRYRAELRSWAEAEAVWHRRHGKADTNRCLGCGEIVQRSTGKVHEIEGILAHATLDCLTAAGRQWRSRASAGLRRLGLVQPRGTEE